MALLHALGFKEDQKGIDSEYRRTVKALSDYYEVFSTPEFKKYQATNLDEALRWITTAVCDAVKKMLDNPKDPEIPATVRVISKKFGYLHQAYCQYQQSQKPLLFSKEMTAILGTSLMTRVLAPTDVKQDASSAVATQANASSSSSSPSLQKT